MEEHGGKAGCSVSGGAGTRGDGATFLTPLSDDVGDGAADIDSAGSDPGAEDERFEVDDDGEKDE